MAEQSAMGRWSLLKGEPHEAQAREFLDFLACVYGREFAMEAAECVTSQETQVDLALTDGLMPSTNSAYEAVIEDGSYPADLVELWRTSVDEGGPRPKSAFYGLISSAVQARWHSPSSVDPDTTPKRSADYLQAVLEGKALL